MIKVVIKKNHWDHVRVLRRKKIMGGVRAKYLYSKVSSKSSRGRGLKYINSQVLIQTFLHGVWKTK